MTTEQQRKMLECAAKACGIEGHYNSITDVIYLDDGFGGERRWWNPLNNSLDTGQMCAKLDINTFFYLTIPRVECSAEDAGDNQVIRYTVAHDVTGAGKEAAWRLAASMVAAKIGGYTE